MERNFTQQTIESLLRQYPTKNALVFHNQHSHYDLCTFCLFCYRLLLADFLQSTTFMYTMKLTSAWALLRAMRSMSLTLALSRLLATVGMRTMQSEGAMLGRALLSFLRNPMIMGCAHHQVISTHLLWHDGYSGRGMWRQ